MRHDEKEISKKNLQALKRKQKTKFFDKNRLFFFGFFSFGNRRFFYLGKPA
ncbi:hypothetical protein [Coleofasciculus chthonoplastes]|uniref:hypothetical protein n=1 Tax=Coleofasciculus chthonoplastes TaxID=64178 RepID=UPI003303F3DC